VANTADANVYEFEQKDQHPPLDANVPDPHKARWFALEAGDTFASTS